MSRWLASAGDPEVAVLAATIAYHFDNTTPLASTILATALLAQTGDRGQELEDQSKENRNV